MPRVAVIGAGWAGLAAVVELADAGIAVDVFEASRTLGGRARAVQWNGLTIDNGQHILIGAYCETLRLMRKVGADPDKLLLRLPLRLEFPGEFLLVAPKLPAPFHTLAALLTAHGIDWREKWAAVRLMLKLQRNNYRIEPDVTVQQWLDNNQTPSRQSRKGDSLRSRQYLWEPLCIAALNTPVADASAQILANVLRDSLGGKREASDLLLPRVDLSSLFPEPAARFIMERHGTVRRGQRINTLRRADDRWYVDAEGPYDQLIVAVAPHHAGKLLAGHGTKTAAMEWQPIVTTYLQYPSSVRLPSPMLGLAEGTAQWLFDRGQGCGQHGLIAAVISAQGRHLQLAAEDLEQVIDQEVRRVAMTDTAPIAATTITEKRATFSACPNLQRPSSELGNALWLAGDAVAGDYPATLEGAVRSGVSAAKGVAEALAR
jgi:squalene-associated FAD-dependent desaturase